MRHGAGMSPSRAHDEAYRRSPEHDDMQIEVMRILLSDPHWKFLDVGDGEPIPSKCVIPEFDLQILGSIVSFADLAQIFVREGRDLPGGKFEREKRILCIYELKPRIESVGGLIRQMKVLEHHAHASLKNKDHRERISVLPVVRSEDPKLEALRFMFRGTVILWNEGERSLRELKGLDSPS